MEPLIVSGFDVFRLVTPNADDELLIDSHAEGRHRISGTSGGAAFESLSFFDVGRLILDMATNNGPAGVDHLVMSGGNLAQSSVDAIEVNAAPSSATVNIEGGITSVETFGLRELRVSQSGTIVNVLKSMQLQSLHIGAGARVVLAPPETPVASVVQGMAIEPDGALDVGESALIVDYNGASPAATIRAQILMGRGHSGFGASWTGTGINSSAAAQANRMVPESRSIGYAENALLPLGAYGNFRGVAVDSTSVLIAYTRTGDANLDGVVNNEDVTILGANYAPGVPKAAWALGDFDYNGFVDNDDVTLLGAFYNPEAAPLTAPAPPDALLVPMSAGERGNFGAQQEPLFPMIELPPEIPDPELRSITLPAVVFSRSKDIESHARRIGDTAQQSVLPAIHRHKHDSNLIDLLANLVVNDQRAHGVRLARVPFASGKSLATTDSIWADW